MKSTLQIEVVKSAAKELRRLPKTEQIKVVRKLTALSSSPYAGKPLKGEYSGLYSVRAWPYRIIYEINKDIIKIHSIAHRQSAYKK